MTRRRAGAALSAAGALLGILMLGGFAREFTRTSAGGDGGTSGGGICVFWGTRTPHYAVNARGSLHLLANGDAGSSAFSAVQAAFAAWAVPTCTDMKPVSDGPTPRFDLTYNPDAGTTDPNINLIVWRPAICSAVVPDGGNCLGSTSCDDTYDCLDDGDAEAIAVTTYFARLDTGAILSAGVELNDADFVFTTETSPSCDYACSDAGLDPDGGTCGKLPPTKAQIPTAVNWPCVVFDTQTILTHEVGHFLGFADTQDAGAVMSRLQPAGGLTRVLTSDDQNAVCTLYPVGAATLETCDAGPNLPKPGGCGCAAGGGSPGAFVGVGLLALALLWRRRSAKPVRLG